MTAAAGITLNSNDNVTAATNIVMTQKGTTSNILMGAGTDLIAGSLSGTAPVSGNLVTSNIAKAGAITINNAGSAITLGFGGTMTSNGGSITVNESKKGGLLSLVAGTTVRANGGNLTLTSAGQVNVNPFNGAAATLSTRTLNKTLGAITMTGALDNTAPARFAVDLGTSSITSGASTTINANGGTLNIQGSLGNAVQITAGSLIVGAPAVGNLATTDIAQAGSINLNGKGTGGILIGTGNSFTSNGADVKLTCAKTVVTMGATNNFKANGGNIIVLAIGSVTGTTGNTFNARAVGAAAPAASTGGGVEIGAGTTTSALAAAFKLPPGTTASNAALGITGGVTNIGGVVTVNKTGGIVTLNDPSLLNLTKGAIVFDAKKAGANVTFQGVDITTSAFKPIAMISPAEPADMVDLGNERVTQAALSVQVSGDNITVGRDGAEMLLFTAANQTYSVPMQDGDVTFVGSAGSVVSIHGDVAVVHKGSVTVRSQNGTVKVATKDRVVDVASNATTFTVNGNKSQLTLANTASAAGSGGTALHVYSAPKTEMAHSNAGVLSIAFGELFVDAASGANIHTNLGSVQARKGSLCSLRNDGNSVYVRALSDVGHTKVVSENREVNLAPGEELLLTNHAPLVTEIKPGDGVGRRGANTREIGAQKFATVSDFSMITFIANSKSFTAQAPNRKLVERMLKTAAAVSMVTQRKGAYTSQALP
jgi:hypothetical protein